MALSHSQGLQEIVPWPILPKAALLSGAAPAEYIHPSRPKGCLGEGSGVSVEMNRRPVKIPNKEGVGKR